MPALSRKSSRSGPAAQKQTHQRPGETLVSTGCITERQSIDALQVQLGIEYIDLSKADIDPDMTKLIPRNLAKKNSVVPVKTLGDELYLAMADPLNHGWRKRRAPPRASASFP